MGLEFKSDFSPLDKTYADMIQQLHDFPLKMADELTNWQRDDMHRQFPNIVMPNDHTVETDIWPRSRSTVPEKRRPTGRTRGRPQGVKTQRLTKSPPGTKLVAGQRPILRPELYDKMHDRMVQLLTTIRWKVFS